MKIMFIFLVYSKFIVGGMFVWLYYVVDFMIECFFLVEVFYSCKKNMLKCFLMCLFKLRKVWKELDYCFVMNFCEEL